MTAPTDRLRALAEAATPGPWMRLWAERTVYDRMSDGCRGIPICRTDWSPPMPQDAANLDYIAAASPDAILRLLDERDAMQRERDSLVAALRASCIDARESLMESGGGCGRAVAAEYERDALAALLREARVGVAYANWAGGNAAPDALLARIDAALDGAKGE